MRGIRFWSNSTGLLFVLALALLAPANALPARSAVAQGDELPELIELPEVDPLSITGDIAIAGSSTVEPIAVAMAARFSDDGYTGNIAVAETGTSAGFERFCKEGSTDINNASRAIKDSERADCAAIGRDVLEFLIGVDALTVVVNKDSFVDELTRSQLIAIFTGAVTRWNEVNPEWPAATIRLFTPGTDSGTFDFFGEAVLGTQGAYKGREARFAALLAPNPTTSENDYMLVEGIRGSENTIGYFGFAYFVENEDALKAVAIADDVANDATGTLIIIPAEDWQAEGVAYVAPSRATAESGEYLLSRPLFIYSATSILQAKPQVAAFVNYYLTNAEEVVAEMDYFPASGEALNTARRAWLGAMGLAE